MNLKFLLVFTGIVVILTGCSASTGSRYEIKEEVETKTSTSTSTEEKAATLRRF